MACNKPYGPKVLFGKAETTRGSLLHPEETDAIRYTEFTLGKLQREVNEINEVRKDRGHNAEVRGRQIAIPWSIKSRYAPSGTAGTGVPEFMALMNLAGLSATDLGATIGYLPLPSDEACARGMSFYTVDRDGLFAEQAVGAVCSQIVIDATNAESPMVTWSGEVARKTEIYATTITEPLTDVATSATLASAACIRNGDPSLTLTGLEIYLQIDSEIVKVTAFNKTTLVATIVRAQKTTVAATHDDNSIVKPWAPAPDYTGYGTAIDPHNWSFNWASAALPVQTCQITIDTGLKFLELEGPHWYPTGVAQGALKVTGQFTQYLTTANAMNQHAMDQHTEVAAILQLGNVAGSEAKIYLDHCQIVDAPDPALTYNEPVTVTVGFRAHSAAGALDAIEIVED